MSIVDVPGGFPEADTDAILKDLGLTTAILSEMPATDYISVLEKLHFDWENAEKMGDFLVALSEKHPAAKSVMRAGAVAIYGYIQKESKTFSFGIAAKIANAKK